jgi:hypothetical protein
MMKHLSYLLISVLLTGAFFSCTDEKYEDDPEPKVENTLLKAKKGGKSEMTTITEPVSSLPVSDGEIIPYIIPGDNPGGNRTCMEVEEAWELEEGYFLCGEKIDYAGDGMWEGEFPDGLEVTVDDEAKRLSFSMDGCITMDGKSYKVGAVIVKGGPKANVYFYEDGTLSDSNLGAPENGMFLVSNLTFCFVECEEQAEELVISVKSFYKREDGTGDFTLSLGEEYPFDTGNWCDDLGINYYPGTSGFGLQDDVGYVTVEEDESMDALVITVDLNDGLTLNKTYLFVGTLSDFLAVELSNLNCPIYEGWPYDDQSNQNTHIFIIPFDDLS